MPTSPTSLKIDFCMCIFAYISLCFTLRHSLPLSCPFSGRWRRRNVAPCVYLFSREVQTKDNPLISNGRPYGTWFAITWVKNNIYLDYNFYKYIYILVGITYNAFRKFIVWVLNYMKKCACSLFLCFYFDSLLFFTKTKVVTST